jgi:hypothetical protein
VIVVSAALAIAGLQLRAAQAVPVVHFAPDDPVMVDRDDAIDASGFAKLELSEAYDLLENQFGKPGDRTPMRAQNVNTIDEVPDSSWFTNRIGTHDLSVDELTRGANSVDPREAAEWNQWVVVSGKGPGGFQPGFRAVRAGDPDRVYQLEVDPKGYPRLATGAEMIGTLIYHALGYNVEDFYVIKVDPRNITIADKATIRDAAGERRFTSHDLHNVLLVAAKDAQGRVYMSAAQTSGGDAGHFEYHGTRSDDPNDIYPHEHRRELRANRVFAAWLAHDDSRAINTRNIKVQADGRTYVRHYMHDFGAILGSSTRFPEPKTSNHEYYIDKGAGLKELFSLGLYTPRYVRVKPPRDMPPSVGWFESASFQPEKWKANYPNTAFSNMQVDDAFWGARLVSRFSDSAIEAIVQQAGYDDPQAVQYLVRTLIHRRDIIARTWLTQINPIVNPALSASGRLTFTNAAVAARVTTGGAYTIAWSSFDNESGATERIAVEKQTDTIGTVPASLLASAQYIAATIWSEHPEYPHWAPVRVYFKRDGAGWKTVGIFRDLAVASS